MIEDLEKDYQKIQEEEKRLNTEIGKIEGKIKVFSGISWFLVVLGFVSGIAGLVYAPSDTALKLSEIGDFVGGTVSTIWSLAGLLFIYVAFLGQQKQMLYQNLELQFSRFELKSTREELKGQKEQMIKQNETMKIQRFETTFFNMLSSLDETINGIITCIEGAIHRGRISFMRIIEAIICKEEESNYTINFIDSCNCIIDEQNEYMHNYFEYIFLILKMIDENPKIRNKNTYIKILNSKLSTNELALLFYYCLSNSSPKEIVLSFDKNIISKNNRLFNQVHYNYYIKKIASLKEEVAL